MRPQLAERWPWLASHAVALRRALDRRFAADEADDIAQETILRVARSTAPIPQGPQAELWLRRVARNIGIDRWRREQRVAPLSLAMHVPAMPDATAERMDVEAAIGRLRPGDRRLLRLVASGVRYSEIAHRERVGTPAIRQRVARARARLVQLLTEVEP